MFSQLAWFSSVYAVWHGRTWFQGGPSNIIRITMKPDCYTTRMHICNECFSDTYVYVRTVSRSSHVPGTWNWEIIQNTGEKNLLYKNVLSTSDGKEFIHPGQRIFFFEYIMRVVLLTWLFSASMKRSKFSQMFFWSRCFLSGKPSVFW